MPHHTAPTITEALRALLQTARAWQANPLDLTKRIAMNAAMNDAEAHLHHADVRQREETGYEISQRLAAGLPGHRDAGCDYPGAAA